MRLPKRKLIIVGASCTGKSSVTADLARRFGLPVRHCSKVLREMLHEAGLSLPGPHSLHLVLDNQTQDWVATTNSALVVEGRFLHYVLAAAPEAFIVRLDCDTEIRQLRAVDRDPDGKSFIAANDAADAEAVASRYGSIASRAIDMQLDTSVLDITQVSAEIARRLDWI